QRRTPFEAACCKRFDVSVLDRLLGVGAIAQHAPRGAVETLIMARGDEANGVRIAGMRARGEFQVAQALIVAGGVHSLPCTPLRWWRRRKVPGAAAKKGAPSPRRSGRCQRRG